MTEPTIPKNPIALLPGAEPIDKIFCANLMRDMTDKAVPAVLKAVQERYRQNRRLR